MAMIRLGTSGEGTAPRLRARASAQRTAAGGSHAFGTERRLPRTRHRVAQVLATMAALTIGGSSRLLACPMCFGAEETSMIDGTRLGVLAMLGVILAVQGAFAAFFIYLRRRAKRIAEIDLETEWSELQRASRTP
jgi:hypothetical protein